MCYQAKDVIRMAKITIEELYRGDRYDIMISVTGNAMHVSLGDLNEICELRSRRNSCVFISAT